MPLYIYIYTCKYIPVCISISVFTSISKSIPILISISTYKHIYGRLSSKPGRPLHEALDRGLDLEFRIWRCFYLYGTFSSSNLSRSRRSSSSSSSSTSSSSSSSSRSSRSSSSFSRRLRPYDFSGCWLHQGLFYNQASSCSTCSGMK